MSRQAAVKPSRPALRWYGGKWNLTDWILSLMPPHEHYVEPFMGGASVLLRKGRSPIETVNDLDSRLVNFFRVLRDHPDDLHRTLTLTPYARAEYNLGAGVSTDPLEDARRFFVQCWQSIGGRRAAGSKSGWRYIKTPGSWLGPAETWCFLDHLYAVADRFKGVQIEQRDAFELMPRLDAPGTLFYVDPPYLHATRAQANGYRHELSDEQHQELLNLLLGLKGKILLSAYPHALYRDALEPAGWVRVTATARVNSRRVGARTEVLWINPRARRHGLFES